MLRIYRRYYIPRGKGELIKALSKWYPKDKARFRDMPINQLYSIYYSKMERLSNEKEKVEKGIEEKVEAVLKG